MTVLSSGMYAETLDVSHRRPPRMYPGRRYPDGGGIQGTGRSLPGQPTRQEPALPPVDRCASATEESMKALTRTTSRRCRVKCRDHREDQSADAGSGPCALIQQ